MSSEYFAHDYNSHRNPKIIKLKVKLGYAGIGMYWSLVEILHEQGGALALHDDCDRDAVAMLLGTDRQTCDQFLQVASTDCKLITLVDNQVRCERVDENLQAREKASKKAKDKAKLRWKKSDATAMPQHSHGNADAMLLNEIKLNKIKENKKKERSPVATAPEPPQILTWPEKLDRPDCRETWAQWMKYRQEIKKPLKSLTGQQAALDRWKDDPAGFIGAIRNSMANGYQGVFEAPPPPNQAKTPIKPLDPNANRPKPKEWVPPWEVELAAKNKAKPTNGYHEAKPSDVGKILASLPPIEPGEVQQ